MGMIDNGYGRFKVINHIEIPKSDMQYDIAVQKIIELDKKYNPFGIFPDRGGGEFQIEILRKHIGKKVRGVFYGETTEVRDPVTNMIEKKALKPFLINQTTLLLERGQLRIPHQSISDIIHRQMVNYQVVRVSEKTKEPVYSSDDEHGLDAMVFALYGFIEDYPQLINIIDDIRPETNMTTIRNQSYTHNPMDEIELNPSKSFDSKPKSDDGSPRYRKVPLGFSKRQKKQTTTNSLGWGAFGSKKQGSPWR